MSLGGSSDFEIPSKGLYNYEHSGDAKSQEKDSPSTHRRGRISEIKDQQPPDNDKISNSPPALRRALSTPSSKHRSVIPIDDASGHSFKICRICEEDIPSTQLGEHSKYCATINLPDVLNLSSEDQLFAIGGKTN